MKIGFDAKRAFHNKRGLGNYSRDLLRILQEKTDFNLVLFNPKKTQKSLFSLSENTKEITPISFFWKKMKSLWRMFKITDIAQCENLAMYHGLSGEIPFGIHKKTKTIVTIHDLIFVRYPQWYSFFDRHMHFFKFKNAAQNAHHIIAISEQTKRDIVDFLHIAPEKISVVYQGCHKAFKQFYSEEKKNEIREKYKLPKQFVLNVGAIEDRKNAFEIVKAIQNIDISLVLVGQKTPYFQQIENFVQKNGMQNRVLVLQNVSMEELAIVYQLATIFCYPSVFEGFGIPIIEALFSKIPVITSQGSCFSEAGGAYSIYVNPIQNTASEIEKNIKELLSDSEKRQQMAEKGYEYVQKFTDDAVFENLLSVYKNVVNN